MSTTTQWRKKVMDRYIMTLNHSMSPRESLTYFFLHWRQNMTFRRHLIQHKWQFHSERCGEKLFAVCQRCFSRVPTHLVVYGACDQTDPLLVRNPEKRIQYLTEWVPLP